MTTTDETVKLTSPDEKCQALQKSCRNLLSPEDIALFRKAYDIASRDETDIDSILDTALIVTAEIGLGKTSLFCALLHKKTEKEIIPIEDIRADFGEKVAQILHGLKEISKIYATRRIVDSENFRKLLLSFAEDIRVQLIFLAEKLHALRLADHLSETEQKKLAKETNYIYIPFAHRLGLYNIKSEMEDRALRYSNPRIYAEISRKLSDTKDAREKYIAGFIAPIVDELNKKGIRFKSKYRTKPSPPS